MAQPLDGVGRVAVGHAERAEHPVGGEGRIGYAWITTGGVTWHNGQTGGYSSWVGFDREADRAVVVLNATSVSVDELAFALMDGE